MPLFFLYKLNQNRIHRGCLLEAWGGCMGYPLEPLGWPFKGFSWTQHVFHSCKFSVSRLSKGFPWGWGQSDFEARSSPVLPLTLLCTLMHDLGLYPVEKWEASALLDLTMKPWGARSTILQEVKTGLQVLNPTWLSLMGNAQIELLPFPAGAYFLSWHLVHVLLIL